MAVAAGSSTPRCSRKRCAAGNTGGQPLLLRLACLDLLAACIINILPRCPPDVTYVHNVGRGLHVVSNCTESGQCCSRANQLLSEFQTMPSRHVRVQSGMQDCIHKVMICTQRTRVHWPGTVQTYIQRVQQEEIDAVVSHGPPSAKLALLTVSMTTHGQQVVFSLTTHHRTTNCKPANQRSCRM